MKENRSKGFTLIELMVVIAIIAILAAVAITSFRSYQKKAKAKELITFARACAQEAIAKCIEDNSTTNFSNLASCKNPSDTKYITSITISTSGDCNSFTVTANGTVDGTLYSATCSYNSTTGDITCTSPTSS